MLFGVAYVLGTQAAGLLDEWQVNRTTKQYRSKAVAQTAAILRRMGTVNVGDTLSNFAFEDIDGELHLLNDILTDLTLITYIRPDCDGCLVEMERLRKAAKGPEDYERVLIISSANPLHLQKLRKDYGLGCLILYDEERLFGSALKIQTYPFNLVVNRDRVILEIHANVMLPDDYERLFSLTSHPEPVEGCPARSFLRNQETSCLVTESLCRLVDWCRRRDNWALASARLTMRWVAKNPAVGM